MIPLICSEMMILLKKNTNWKLMMTVMIVVMVMVPTLMSTDEEAESTHNVDDMFFKRRQLRSDMFPDTLLMIWYDMQY